MARPAIIIYDGSETDPTTAEVYLSLTSSGEPVLYVYAIRYGRQSAASTRTMSQAIPSHRVRNVKAHRLTPKGVWKRGDTLKGAVQKYVWDLIAGEATRDPLA